MRCAKRCLLVLTVLLAVHGSARAAALLKLEVVPDGSLAPPGDRIDASLLFLPGDEAIAFEVRAFVKPGGAEGNVVAVDANDDVHRDARGKWFTGLQVQRPKTGEPAVEVQVVVPYASLKLSPGTYELAYEVRGLRDGKVEFVQATPMTRLKVSNGVRTITSRGEDVTAARPTKEKRTAYTIKDGKPVAQTIEIPSEAPELHREVQEVKVDVPGEFYRPRTFNVRAAPNRADENAIKNSVVPLEGKAWTCLSDFVPKHERTVYFVTNRNVVHPEQATPDRFGNDVSPQVTYGTCLVNIPVEHHARGELEVPSYWWQARDPTKYFLIEALSTLSRDVFFQTLSSDDLLLFIHGYNTTFEAAVLRTSQLVHDLRFPGKGVTFSWPSQGALSGYARDETQNAKSVGALVEVLKELTEPIGTTGKSRKVHIISHSMGNRLFLQAARQYELDNAAKAKGPVFGHVALAAPDVDAASFSALVPAVLRQSDTTTLYYCQSDRALLASRTVHMDKPVGLGPFFAAGLDTVNADKANTSFLGHGYFASAHPLLIDLQLTIVHNEKPAKRLPPLGFHTIIMGYDHWSLLDPAKVHFPLQR